MIRLLLTLAALASGAAPALAHLDPAEHGSLMAGLTHPVSGADHILAMITVGLWAMLMGGRAMWLVPLTFLGAMVVGFAAAVWGVALPYVEPAVLASVVALGLLAALAVQLPVAAGAAVVATFGVFHGYAHGTEMGQAGAWAYGAGFALASAILHGAGLALGHAMRRLLGVAQGRAAGRAFGAAAAIGGLAMVFA
jgi:urease accessory protein